MTKNSILEDKQFIVPYEKKRNSSEVSGWNRFVEAVVLVTQNRLKAEEIVRRIGRTVTQARKEQDDNQDEKAFAPGQGQEETKEQEQPDGR